MSYFQTEYHLNNCKKAQIKAAESSHLSRLKRIEEYNKAPKLCPACQAPIPYDKNNKYCSRSCSCRTRNLGRKRTEEEKRKCSEKLKQSFINSGKRRKTVQTKTGYKKTDTKSKICIICQSEFLAHYPYRAKMCSDKCRNKNTSNRIKERVKQGIHKGWSSRKNRKPSFPEHFFMSLFESRGIEYLHEEKIGKYFGDFVIDKNVLEIDGKQHEWPERKLKDAEKDKFLTENGYKVTRIKWRNCKKYCKELVAEFEKFLASIE